MLPIQARVSFTLLCAHAARACSFWNQQQAQQAAAAAYAAAGGYAGGSMFPIHPPISAGQAQLAYMFAPGTVQPMQHILVPVPMPMQPSMQSMQPMMMYHPGHYQQPHPHSQQQPRVPQQPQQALQQQHASLPGRQLAQRQQHAQHDSGSGHESTEQPEFLATIFDDVPDFSSHHDAPSPPPLPPDFQLNSMAPVRPLFNFSQFSQRMPHSRFVCAYHRLGGMHGCAVLCVSPLHGNCVPPACQLSILCSMPDRLQLLTAAEFDTGLSCSQLKQCGAWSNLSHVSSSCVTTHSPSPFLSVSLSYLSLSLSL